MPSIDRASSTPFYQQVYEQIAHGIENGFYPAGKKLPSIRESARALGVSNTTIELAYQRLVEEGFVEARRGSGFTICAVGSTSTAPNERLSEEFRALRSELERSSQGASAAPVAFDFAYDAADGSTFPAITWARISREVFFSEGAERACLYNDPQGLLEFREQIARYLCGEYGIDCTAEQVLVKPTTRDLVSEIVSLFDPSSTVFAMENPGYDEVGRRLRERGFSLTHITVHPYPTWEQAERELRDASIVFATPASHFPSNHAMPLEMRTQLVKWAEHNDAYIIDDEYGWEFQAGTGRIPPLATLDTTGRVITLGTFSNSFTPAVCLSYAVLPPQLMIEWRRAKGGTHPQVPWQTQAAMASFMREDHWRTHVRKIRTTMLRKRDLLLDAIERHMEGNVEVVVGASSLFVLAKTRDGRSEDELIEAAAAKGVRVYPTSRYWCGAVPEDWRYVLIGYAGIPAEAIGDGIAALADAWGFAS